MRLAFVSGASAIVALLALALAVASTHQAQVLWDALGAASAAFALGSAMSAGCFRLFRVPVGVSGAPVVV